MKPNDLELLTQELRRHAAYLAEAQRLSHTGSFGWKPATGEIVWSDETYRIFEYNSAEKPTLDLVLERIHPQDRALAQQLIEDVSKSGTDFEHEYRLVMQNGAIKHVHVRAHLLRDSRALAPTNRHTRPLAAEGAFWRPACNGNGPSCSLRKVTANWNDPYRKALQETDRKCVAVAVRLAENAVHARLDELAVMSDAGNGMERAALNTALRDLIALKAEYNLT